MVKLIIKKTGTTKSLVCLAKVLDLFLWHLILVLLLGILGFCGEGCCLPLFSDSLWDRWLQSFGFFPTFLGLMGHLLEVGALKGSHQMTGL
jgi:hypothetical protein